MMTSFDYAVRLLSTLPFEQQVAVIYGATCWTEEKFDSTQGESGHAAIKLLRELSPTDRAAALYEASLPIDASPKPRPMLKLVSSHEGINQ